MNLRTTFTGHIIERLRPGGFPKTVSCFIEAEDTSLEVYRDIVNQVVGAIAKQGVMVIPKKDVDMMSVVDNSGLKEFDRNFIVPLHMISHITTVTESFSNPDETEKVMIN